MFNFIVINRKRLNKIPSAYRGKVNKVIRDLIDMVSDERKKRNISQERFAELLNLSTKAYQSYEQGTRRPSVETLVLMLVVLELPIYKFLKS